MTDRVRVGVGPAAFNQRTSLRLCTDLPALGRYFAECPLLVTRICALDKDIGICSMDLRKLIPTEDPKHFLERFCNSERALTIQERCYILRCGEPSDREDGRRPYVDIEMSLKYLGAKRDSIQKTKPGLTARSVTQLESGREQETLDQERTLNYKSGSCTNLVEDFGKVGYTSMAAGNTQSQEKLLASRFRPFTSDVQVQCERTGDTGDKLDGKMDDEPVKISAMDNMKEREPVRLETSKSDNCITHNEKDMVKIAISPLERDAIMQKFVDELEDWKEKQQELFKCQLKQKEEYHLELLAKEWARKRVELECRLSAGVEQCRALAADLSRATEDFRLRGYRNTEREKKLLDAKKALEAHYTAKYQELREASQKMEQDMQHCLKLKDMRIEELEIKLQQLEKQIELLKNNLKNCEKEAESKYSGLTKDQTASLIQELRHLEEKFHSAVQSKAFFKEQWGRAVRELHLSKLHTRQHMLTQLQHDREQLADMGLETVEDQEETNKNRSRIDLNRLTDDIYVDILANTPALETDSIINAGCPGGMEMFDNIKNVPKNPLNERLTELTAQRDRLVQQDNPDENLLKQLNHEIRSLLLNCGS